MAVDAGLRARYSPTGQRWGLYADVTHSDLTGRDGTRGEMRFGAGVTMTFGQSGAVTTADRPFGDYDAVGGLVRRGLR